MAGRRPDQFQRGAALLIFMILLVMSALTYVVNSLTPEAIEAARIQKTNEALALARDALIGYALQYRDEQIAQGQQDRVYGYLPLPDLGYNADHTLDSNRNDNAGCQGEGCDAAQAKPTGSIGLNYTVIGRFPWKLLGTGPLRDGNGECLWYAVSGSHQKQQRVTPMNWDTLGQLDYVIDQAGVPVAANLVAHDRPAAIIFSPGPALTSRSRSTTNAVDECGGNYIVSDYLDITNLGPDFSTVNKASGDTSLAAKPLSIQGAHTFSNGGAPIIANDVGLPITSETLFGAIRKNANFRNDINAMLDRMVSCLRDDLAASTSFKPVAIPSPPDDSLAIDPAISPYRAAGRIYSHTCYDDTATAVNTVNPKGYFASYKNQLFVAACPGVIQNVNGTLCGGTLLFAGERSPSQSRATQQERNNPAKYLEDPNATSFATLQAINYAGCTVGGTFAGDTQFKNLVSGQVKHQDIVRCIPNTPSLSVVAPSVNTLAGSPVQLASYAPATRTLTLGSAAIHSNYGATPTELYACAWTPETHAAGSGFRSYFRFRIRQVGEGFTFAVIDGDRNDKPVSGYDVCGSARQHLGYSGNNLVTPYIQPPKLAVEFDTLRNGSFAEPASLSNGRNDPCFWGSCGSTQNLSSNAHVGIVYWGYASSHTASQPVVNQTQEDDNVHGFPWPTNFSWPQTFPWPPGVPTPPDAATRPAPRNPDVTMPYDTNSPSEPAPGVVPWPRMGAPTSPITDASAKREFHARIEVTRSFTLPVDAKDGATGIQIRLWIEPHLSSKISTMTYNTGSPPTLLVTTAGPDGHGFTTGDTVVIKDAVPTGYNGEYPVTVINANNFIATLPTGKPDPGKYISYICWGSVTSCTNGGTNLAVVTSSDHGLGLAGDMVTATISGAIPAEFNGTRTVTVIDANTYRFSLVLSYEPGDMPPAIAAAKALTPRAIALANTTRPMSLLDASFKPIITDSATIYDEQMPTSDCPTTPCGSGQACGSDNKCYRPSFRNLRLGFTIGERATSSTNTSRGQLIEIKDQATTWLE
jgi:hypothetical protein